MKLPRAVLFAGLLAGASGTAASATTSATWSNACIASSLTTCASVQVAFNSVTNTVTMKVWNLGTGAFSLDEILTEIGLMNNVNVIPIGSTVTGMTGFGPDPTFAGTGDWAIFNNQHPNGGGAITLDFLGAVGSTPSGNPTSSVNNGIVNSCSSLAGSGKFWVSQCGGGTAVSFSFQVQPVAGWDLSQSQLYFKAQGLGGSADASLHCLTGSTGSTACSSTATPEPATLLLLATGLSAVALPALRRRRLR